MLRLQNSGKHIDARPSRLLDLPHYNECFYNRICVKASNAAGALVVLLLI